ncbi:MAG: Heme/hemopexin-binding protein [Candidatus Anoxychlamydiales bacterium]|nr:Heme/hemopexin-binding protein [Candidatus Anoxychlamydiales bacterium]
MKITTKIFLILVAFKAFANPSGENVVSGNIEIDRKNNVLNIYQSSDQAIINWQDFSIKDFETTNIISANDNFAILNRVISDAPSHVFGKLISNANVFLINQNGILIGKNAIIDTKALTLSTLNITDDEFLNANDLRFQTSSFEKIVNKGKVTAVDDIYIIAKDVQNEAEIESKNGSINLIGALDAILVERKNPQISVGIKNVGSVENSGSLKAINVELKAAGNNIYSLALNSDGIIDAKGAYEKDGRVILSAEEGVVAINGEIKGSDIEITADHIHVENEAILDVRESSKDAQILIGGDFQGKNPNIKNAKTTYIHEGAQIYADGCKNNAGKVIVFSEDTTIFEGAISATSIDKDGGFVEISSKNNLIITGVVDLTSALGKKGDLLLDPGRVTIIHSLEKENDNNIFSDSFINEMLKISNVEISTYNSDNNEEQTIFFDKDVNIFWEDDTKLSLIAKRNIYIDENVQIENASDNNFLAMHFKTMGENGNFTGIFLDENSKISTKAANVKLEGISGNSLDNNYGIHIKGSIISKNEDASAGDVSLIGRAKRADNENIGIYFDSGNIFAKNARIFIDGTSAGTKETNDGICFDNFSKVKLISSKLTLNGKASGTNSTGVNFLKTHIEALGSSLIDVYGTESGKLGINISKDAKLFSFGTINLKATNSIHSHGQIVSQGKVNVNIGLENDGSFVLKKTIYAKNLEISGSDYNDTFYFYSPQKCIVFGKAGTNTIMSPDLANVFEVKDLNRGRLNNSIAFYNIQNLKGSIYLDDMFIFELNGKLSGKIDGYGGKNTIKAPSLKNLWNITSEDTGYIHGIVNFSNVQNLIGGSTNDRFEFLTNAKINGIINGEGGYNVLDYSNSLSDTTIDLHKLINIHEVIGSKANNILIGPEDLNTWSISGSNSGDVNGIKFSNIQNLIGSGINDTFYVLDSGKLDGEINGSSGINSLYAPNNINFWHLTGVNRGYIENVVAFSNIQNLFGGDKQDVYQFVDYAFVTGTIDGMSREKNILDFSKHTSEVSIDLNNIENIQEIIGGGKTTLIGRNVDNIWNITNENTGVLNEKIAFVNIENIIGGDKKDIFTVTRDAQILGYIDGSAGENIIYAPDQDNIWNIYASNEGNLNNNTNFKNISNIIGSDLTNTFNFENDGKIDGKIDGGKGKNNVLDFSKQTNPVVVDLNKIENVSTIIGSKGSDQLIGKDKNNIWYFSGMNKGYVQDIEFIGFENIKGGNSSDIFIFKDDTGVSGVIDGGCDISMNILDYSMCTKPITADMTSGETSNTFRSANIQACVLPKLSRIDAKDMASSIEIPLYLCDWDFEYAEDDFVKLFANSKIVSEEGKLFENVDFPIYFSDDLENFLVYRANSPFIITKKTQGAQFLKITMSPYLSDIRVADDSVRMKNNLYKTIHNEKIAIRGDLKQANVIYESEDDGFDLQDFAIITQNVKEKSIKQRPRPLHFYSK